MTDLKMLEKTDFKDFKKPERMELIFINKGEFLEWYKNTKGIMKEIEMKKKVDNKDYQECPNCKSIMESYIIKSTANNELWHLCSKCNLTFSERQHDYFTLMILRLLNNDINNEN